MTPDSGRHGPFVRADDDGLVVEVDVDDIPPAVAERINRADLVPMSSFGFGPPRPYNWREIARLIRVGWWSRGR